MLSKQFALSQKNVKPENKRIESLTLKHVNQSDDKKIELPKSPKIEPIKQIPIDIKSNEISSAMCNFDPNVIACTPPDGYFMHNLRARMDKM